METSCPFGRRSTANNRKSAFHRAFLPALHPRSQHTYSLPIFVARQIGVRSYAVLGEHGIRSSAEPAGRCHGAPRSDRSAAGHDGHQGRLGEARNQAHQQVLEHHVRHSRHGRGSGRHGDPSLAIAERRPAFSRIASLPVIRANEASRIYKKYQPSIVQLHLFKCRRVYIAIFVQRIGVDYFHSPKCIVWLFYNKPMA